VSKSNLLEVDRFLQTLEIVSREGKHLSYSWQRLFSESIDADWVRGLETKPELAERLEAFVSRFGRLQDTIADKLLPRLLLAVAETPGSQIETLNRAERLEVVEDVERWLEARKLHNRLVHEYLESPETFAQELSLAKEYSRMLMDTYMRLRSFAIRRMDIEETKLPEQIELPVLAEGK